MKVRASRGLVWVQLETGKEHELEMSVPKKGRNAVERNLLRRRLREAVRLSGKDVPWGDTKVSAGVRKGGEASFDEMAIVVADARRVLAKRQG